MCKCAQNCKLRSEFGVELLLKASIINVSCNFLGELGYRNWRFVRFVWQGGVVVIKKGFGVSWLFRVLQTSWNIILCLRIVSTVRLTFKWFHKLETNPNWGLILVFVLYQWTCSPEWIGLADVPVRLFNPGGFLFGLLFHQCTEWAYCCEIGFLIFACCALCPWFKELGVLFFMIYSIFMITNCSTSVIK